MALWRPIAILALFSIRLCVVWLGEFHTTWGLWGQKPWISLAVNQTDRSLYHRAVRTEGDVSLALLIMFSHSIRAFTVVWSLLLMATFIWSLIKMLGCNEGHRHLIKPGKCTFNLSKLSGHKKLANSYCLMSYFVVLYMLYCSTTHYFLMSFLGGQFPLKYTLQHL